MILGSCIGSTGRDAEALENLQIAESLGAQRENCQVMQLVALGALRRWKEARAVLGELEARPEGKQLIESPMIRKRVEEIRKLICQEGATTATTDTVPRPEYIPTELAALLQRMQENPIPDGALRFDRNKLHER